MCATTSPALLIIGTGALANLFAARLSAVDVPVAMMGNWPEGLAALQENGVTLAENGAEKNFPVQVISPEDGSEKYKFAIVLVKSWQTERAAQQLMDVLAPDGAALTLQNGLGNKEKLAAALGSAHVVLGVTTTGATLLQPGRVRPGGEGKISLESHPGTPDFVGFFNKAGFDVEIAAEVDALIWSKLVINAAINPLTTILRIANGELLDLPSARAMMAALAFETAQVASYQGITLLFDDPIAAAEDVARRTATNRSSMLQDITRGAPTEIDAICGAIVKTGKRVGVDTPINHTLWLLVKAAVEKNTAKEARKT